MGTLEAQARKSVVPVTVEVAGGTFRIESHPGSGARLMGALPARPASAAV